MKLYEPFIERDLEAIPAAVRDFRAEHSSEELWQAVSRFAILAYAPSQHSKHALFCCLAAWDLRQSLGNRFDEVITECAIYAAASRQPWSEPPFLDPPAVEGNAPRDADELRQAIAETDRLRAERWLAARFEDADFSTDYFGVAAEDSEDLGHKLIVAVAAFRLADLLGEKGRFAALRVGIWEMVAYRGPASDARTANAVDPEELALRLTNRMVAERGDLVAAHRLFLLDAAFLTEDRGVLARVCRSLQREIDGEPSASIEPRTQRAGDSSTNLQGTDDREGEAPVYSLSRDYGELLKSCAVARRLTKRFPSIDAASIIEAARDHLASAPTSEGMTFA